MKVRLLETPVTSLDATYDTTRDISTTQRPLQRLLLLTGGSKLVILRSETRTTSLRS